MIMLFRKKLTVSMGSPQQPHQNQSWLSTRTCCIYVGTSRDHTLQASETQGNYKFRHVLHKIWFLEWNPEKRLCLVNRKKIILHHLRHITYCFGPSQADCWSKLGNSSVPGLLSRSFDFHLLWSLQKFLNGQNFNNETDTINAVLALFDSKNKSSTKME